MTYPSQDILIGAHTSTSGGLQEALEEGKNIGATTIQFFTSNQKQWKGRHLTADIIDSWKKAQDETQIFQTMSHDSYLINLGSPDPLLLEKSRIAFEEELQRCHTLNVTYLNFHPGAYTTSSLDVCLDTICDSLKKLESLSAKGSTKLLLETTAGQGTSVGHRFEHLAYIIDRVKGFIPIGVCIDTCHIFSAGYDIRSRPAWEGTLKQFDTIIGLDYLKAFHVNDSKTALGSRVDRHANLGEGTIGLESFEVLMSHPRLKALPKYLETPNGETLWKQEIHLLKQYAQTPYQSLLPEGKSL